MLTIMSVCVWQRVLVNNVTEELANRFRSNYRSTDRGRSVWISNTHAGPLKANFRPTYLSLRPYDIDQT